MVNNGVAVVQSTWSAISQYPDAGYQAIVKRQDDPSISGDQKWITYRSSNSAGWENDFGYVEFQLGDHRSEDP